MSKTYEREGSKFWGLKYNRKILLDTINRSELILYKTIIKVRYEIQQVKLLLLLLLFSVDGLLQI